jgi:hypothetical protein
MLGDTISITHNAVARVLSKINQDNYSAKYLLRTTTDEFVVNVRHSTESSKPGVIPYDRHNFEFSHTVFATPTTLEQTRIASHTIRCRRSDDPAAALLAAKAEVAWLTDANLTKLIAWES